MHHIEGRLTSEKYIRILQNYLVPYAWARFGATEENPVKFVQDKSSIHMSHIVMDWFEEEGKEFELLPWPPKGADFNPIENVWSEMCSSMDAQQVANGDELWNTVNRIWEDLARRPLYWQGLSNSMVSRLELARQVNGDWTKY